MSIIVDKNIGSDAFDTLKALNINYIKSCSLDFLYKPVNTHPDMQIHFAAAKTAFCAPSAYRHYKTALSSDITLICGENDPAGTYPDDCAYNVARLGKRIVGNLKHTDKKILSFYETHGFELIDVKQGYTKCNMCIVDENSVITEDAGLCKALKAHGIDVLKLQCGEVSLNGFKNGFIGGASGLIGAHRLAFWGDYGFHSQKNLIESFIKSKKVDIINLLYTKLQDFGSILYVDDGL